MFEIGCKVQIQDNYKRDGHKSDNISLVNTNDSNNNNAAGIKAINMNNN